jgi:hypothetical protein
MSKFDTISDAPPKAVMSEAELKAWESLPANVQLERLRQAIDQGVQCADSGRTMQDILNDVLARHPDARL